MHMAHYTGNYQVIELLRSHGANINARNHEGKKPLHCLLEKEDVEVGTKLEIIEKFKSYYDFTIQDSEGKTPLDCARECCSEAEVLIESITHYSDVTNLVSDITGQGDHDDGNLAMPGNNTLLYFEPE